MGRASEGWSPAKVNLERAKRIAGIERTNTERRKEAEAERLKAGGPMTIDSLWAIYREANSGKPSLKADSFRYKKHLAKRFGGKLPEEISTTDIDALRVSMIRRGLAAQTVKHALGQVRRLIRFGVKRGFCAMPPNLFFEMPQVDNQRTESMSDEQLAAYMRALAEEPDQDAAAFLRLALVTGMRRGALLGLRWDDIDFEGGHITLRGENAKKGKTEYIPLTAATRAVLKKVKRTESPYVFPGRDGGKRKDFRRMARRVRDKAGLPKDFRPLHGLRHSFASYLASSGKVDLYMLQKLLTHESPQMTQRYAHLADEAMKRAASVADAMLDISTDVKRNKKS